MGEQFVSAINNLFVDHDLRGQLDLVRPMARVAEHAGYSEALTFLPMIKKNDHEQLLVLFTGLQMLTGFEFRRLEVRWGLRDWWGLAGSGVDARGVRAGGWRGEWGPRDWRVWPGARLENRPHHFL